MDMETKIAELEHRIAELEKDRAIAFKTGWERRAAGDIHISVIRDDRTGAALRGYASRRG